MLDVVQWFVFFLIGAGLPFTAYVVLQCVAIVKLHGAARLWVALPVPFMAWMTYLTVVGYRVESNLWPIPILLGGPLAVLYVGAILVIGLRIERDRRLAAAAPTDKKTGALP